MVYFFSEKTQFKRPNWAQQKHHKNTTKKKQIA